MFINNYKHFTSLFHACLFDYFLPLWAEFRCPLNFIILSYRETANNSIEYFCLIFLTILISYFHSIIWVINCYHRFIIFTYFDSIFKYFGNYICMIYISESIISLLLRHIKFILSYSSRTNIFNITTKFGSQYSSVQMHKSHVIISLAQPCQYILIHLIISIFHEFFKHTIYLGILFFKLLLI